VGVCGGKHNTVIVSEYIYTYSICSSASVALPMALYKYVYDYDYKCGVLRVLNAVLYRRLTCPVSLTPPLATHPLMSLDSLTTLEQYKSFTYLQKLFCPARHM